MNNVIIPLHYEQRVNSFKVFTLVNEIVNEITRGKKQFTIHIFVLNCALI